MTKQKSVTINIVLPPANATCTPACYDPPNVKVKVGTTITWVNKSTTPHTVTAMEGLNPTAEKAAPQIFDKRPAVVQNDQLRPSAERDFEQRRVFEIDFEQLDDVPQHMIPGSRRAFLRQRQNFSDSDSQSLLPALEFFEQAAPGLGGAALFAELRQLLSSPRLLLVQFTPAIVKRLQLVA